MTCVPMTFQPLEPDTMYGVATQSYIAQGGLGFSALSRSSSRTVGDVDVDVIKKFIKDTGTISENLDGRIEVAESSGSMILTHCGLMLPLVLLAAALSLIG